MQSKRSRQYKNNGTNLYQVRRVQSMIPPHPPEKGGLQRTRIIRHSESLHPEKFKLPLMVDAIETQRVHNHNSWYVGLAALQC